MNKLCLIKFVFYFTSYWTIKRTYYWTIIKSIIKPIAGLSKETIIKPIIELLKEPIINPIIELLKEHIIDWFKWHVNLSRVILCLEVRIIHIYIFCHCFLNFFYTWSYQMQIILKWIYLNHNWNPIRYYHSR